MGRLTHRAAADAAPFAGRPLLPRLVSPRAAVGYAGACRRHAAEGRDALGGHKTRVKRAAIVVLVLASLCGLVWLWNYLELARPVDDTLRKDPRNEGIKASLHFDHFISPAVLVFDLSDVSAERSAADVFRVFLQSAYTLRDHRFETVRLSFRGTVRFVIAGEYFRQLGNEYNQQNPVFTMRTFPEHLMLPDGSRAYSSWTGGLLGVVTRQMQDFLDFHKRWYLADVLPTAKSSTELPAEPTPPFSSAESEMPETAQRSVDTSAAPAYAAPLEPSPLRGGPVSKPSITTAAPETAKRSWAEQVYVDSANKYFYPENCPSRPSTAGRMPRSFAIHAGFTLAPTCKER